MIEKRSNKTDVFVPAYKAQNYISDLFDSLNVQTLIPRRVYVGIDNCESTLESLKKLSKSKNYAFDLKIFYSPKKLGPYVMKNELISRSDSENIVLIDADDYVCKNYVFWKEKKLAENPRSVVAAEKWVWFQEIGNGSKKRVTKTTRPYYCGCNSYSRKTFEDVGFYLSVLCSGDSEWLNRAKFFKHNLIKCPATYFYRRHGGQLTHKHPPRANTLHPDRSLVKDIIAKKRFSKPEFISCEVLKVVHEKFQK